MRGLNVSSYHRVNKAGRHCGVIYPAFLMRLAPLHQVPEVHSFNAVLARSEQIEE